MTTSLLLFVGVLFAAVPVAAQLPVAVPESLVTYLNSSCWAAGDDTGRVVRQRQRVEVPGRWQRAHRHHDWQVQPAKTAFVATLTATLPVLAATVDSLRFTTDGSPEREEFNLTVVDTNNMNYTRRSLVAGSMNRFGALTRRLPNEVSLLCAFTVASLPTHLAGCWRAPFDGGARFPNGSEWQFAPSSSMFAFTAKIGVLTPNKTALTRTLETNYTLVSATNSQFAFKIFDNDPSTTATTLDITVSLLSPNTMFYTRLPGMSITRSGILTRISGPSPLCPAAGPSPTPAPTPSPMTAAPPTTPVPRPHPRRCARWRPLRHRPFRHQSPRRRQRP